MKHLTVYVITSNGYLPALGPFAYLFNKYWGPQQEVIVCGYDAPKFSLPDNFDFFSIGKQEDYPITKWSDALIRVLLHFPLRDVFCLMLEDYWITRRCDLRAIYMLTDYMRQFRNVVKMDMRTDRRFSGNCEKDFPTNRCDFIPLVMSDPRGAYHMSLMCGLWNREAMLRILTPGEDPWQVETSGETSRKLSSLANELIVLGTDNIELPQCGPSYPDPWCPIPHTLAHRGGDPGVLATDRDPAYPILKSDLLEMKEKGLVCENGGAWIVCQ